jgi:hypothetical protein
MITELYLLPQVPAGDGGKMGILKVHQMFYCLLEELTLELDPDDGIAVTSNGGGYRIAVDTDPLAESLLKRCDQCLGSKSIICSIASVV